MRAGAILLAIGFVLCCVTMAALAATQHQNMKCDLSTNTNPVAETGCHNQTVACTPILLQGRTVLQTRGYRICTGPAPNECCKDGTNWVCQYNSWWGIWDPDYQTCWDGETTYHEVTHVTCNRYVL